MSEKKESGQNDSYPTTKKNKFDIFNSNVRNPGGFIFIYALIGVMCISMLIFFAVRSTPRSHEDLEYSNVRFNRYEIQDEHLLLYVDGNNKYYSVPAYRRTMINPEIFLYLCNSGAVFHVGYVDDPKADEPHFGLESIQDTNGTVYLSMEAIYEYRWGSAPAFYVIFGGLTILWFFFVVMSVYVGRHPERFRHRTIKLFFKDGAIRHYQN